MILDDKNEELAKKQPEGRPPEDQEASGEARRIKLIKNGVGEIVPEWSRVQVHTLGPENHGVFGRGILRVGI